MLSFLGGNEVIVVDIIEVMINTGLVIEGCVYGSGKPILGLFHGEHTPYSSEIARKSGATLSIEKARQYRSRSPARGEPIVTRHRDSRSRSPAATVHERRPTVTPRPTVAPQQTVAPRALGPPVG